MPSDVKFLLKNLRETRSRKGKKMTKRILTKVLAVAMVMIMMLGVCAPVASAAWTHHDHEHEKNEINYVSLGDSMTNGYGLPGYDGNTGVEDYGDGSYANLFAEWMAKTYGITVDHAQLAMSGMRAEDLHWLLELDYTDDEAIAITDGAWDEKAWNEKFTTGDYWTWSELCNDYRFAVAANTIKNGDPTSKITAKEAAIVAEYYQNAVANADVITLGMGNGNFGVFMFGNLLAAIGFDGEPADVMIYDVDRALAELDPSIRSEVNVLINKVEGIVDDYLAGMLGDAEQVEAVRNIVLYTVIGYVLNYIGSVEAILELNPDAEIILVGLMNTLADSDSEVEGVTMGALLDAIFTPLNAFIAALPTCMQATGNKAYADATFYYAEAPEVECLVKTFGDDFYKLDGTPNVNSVIRQRFVANIVGTEEDPGMVWEILAGTEISGATITYVDYKSVLEYDYAARFESEALADAYAEAAANEDTARLSKLISAAVYLAFENAILAAAEEEAPATIDSIMNLGGVSPELFDGVLENFDANVGTAGNKYEAVCQAAIIKVAKDIAADEVLDKFAEENFDIFTANDVKALVEGTKTVENFKSEISAWITEELATDARQEEINDAIYDEVKKEMLLDPEFEAGLATLGHTFEECLACTEHNACKTVQSEFDAACEEKYPEAYDEAVKEANTEIANTINDAIVDINNAINEAAEEYTSILCSALAIPEALGASLNADETVNGLLSMLARFVLGDGVGSHPSAKGHEALFEAVAKSYFDGYTAKDETIGNLNALANLAYTKAYAKLKATGKIDLVQNYINKADSLLAAGCDELVAFQVSAELANLKSLLLEEIIDTRYTLAQINEILDQENLDEETWALLLSLKDELSTHISNIKAIAKEIKFVVDPYIDAAIILAERYVELLNQMIADAYNLLTEKTAEFKSEYLAFVDKAGSIADKIAPELGTAVRKFLIDSPKDAMAIVYAYGEDAVLKLAVDAANAAGDIYNAVSALAALLEAHGEDIYYAVKASDEYRDAVRAAKALIKEIKDLTEEAKNAPVSTALAYKQHIAELKADLKAVYADLYDLAFAAIAEVKPGVALMLEDTLNTIAESIDIIKYAGEAYGSWLMGHTKAMMGEIFASLMENTEELINTAIPVFKAIIVKTLADLDALIEEFVGEIELELSVQIETLEALLTNLKSRIDASMGDELRVIIADLEAKLAELKGVLATGIRGQLADVLDYLRDIKAELVALVKAVANSGLDFSTVDFENFISSIEAILNYVSGEGYEELKANIKAFVKDALDYITAVTGPQINDLLKDEALYFDYTISENSYYLAIGNFATVEGSYAEILAEKLGGVDGITFDNSTLRVSDLLALIDENYVNDAYGAKFNELNAELREQVIAEIAAADLISVDFGTADFTTFGVNQIVSYLLDSIDGLRATIDDINPGMLDAYVQYEMDWSRFDIIYNFVDVDALLAEVKNILVANDIPEIYEIPIGELDATIKVPVADIITYAVETYLYTFTNYVVNYDAVIDAIYAINPDAEIVLVGSYNIFDGLVISLEGYGMIDLTPVGDIIASALNAHAFANAVLLPNTTYVGIEDARADAEGIVLENLISFNDETFEIALNTEAFGITAAGNVYVAEQILAAMNITCEHIYDGCEDADCNYCGAIREAGKHVYDDCADAECNVCGEIRVAPGHVYDGCEDTDCNVCGATRPAGTHEYDEDCTDADCNKCGALRAAKSEHSYTDCEDTTCNNEGCKVTREAQTHEYDDCLDTTCNKCGKTRTAPGHIYDDCADADCNACGKTRTAPGHIYDDDCMDDTCNVCNKVTREAKQHVYDSCEDTTCNNCAHQRAALEHVFEDCADSTCENCSYTRIAPGHTYDDDCSDTICNVCGAERLAKAHVYEDCEDITCANCSVTRVAPGHTWGEWEITKAPTFDEKGERQRTCSVCGKVAVESIDKLVAEDDGKGKDDDKDSSTSVGGTDEKPGEEPTPVDEGLSGGAIAAIIIGAVLVLGLGGFAVYWFIIKKNTFAALIVAIKGIFAAIGGFFKNLFTKK